MTKRALLQCRAAAAWAACTSRTDEYVHVQFTCTWTSHQTNGGAKAPPFCFQAEMRFIGRYEETDSYRCRAASRWLLRFDWPVHRILPSRRSRRQDRAAG